MARQYAATTSHPSSAWAQAYHDGYASHANQAAQTKHHFLPPPAPALAQPGYWYQQAHIALPQMRRSPGNPFQGLAHGPHSYTDDSSTATPETPDSLMSAADRSSQDHDSSIDDAEGRTEFDFQIDPDAGDPIEDSLTITNHSDLILGSEWIVPTRQQAMAEAGSHMGEAEIWSLHEVDGVEEGVVIREPARMTGLCMSGGLSGSSQ
ncbi:Uu.00g042580.m01.CDS01 [Anthostomella pinea]|uniref:Uu.00g042580.m01.CDS01 n=1 Tax=Anthostomella pinea TaxID=933095 RepID=A0AAI8YE44_9PEZI|nr:Uu.00g042580.m01.CDS01 [Anthostomella pinea]